MRRTVSSIWWFIKSIRKTGNGRSHHVRLYTSRSAFPCTCRCDGLIRLNTWAVHTHETEMQYNSSIVDMIYEWHSGIIHNVRWEEVSPVLNINHFRRKFDTCMTAGIGIWVLYWISSVLGLPFDLIERQMQGQLMTAKEYFVKSLENIYPFRVSSFIKSWCWRVL